MMGGDPQAGMASLMKMLGGGGAQGGGEQFGQLGDEFGDGAQGFSVSSSVPLPAQGWQ